jgi:hypothetical protein
VLVDPLSRCAVEIGTTARSSSLEPDVVAPDSASTPITVSAVPSTVTVCPTGLPTLNSSEAVSEPRTTTFAPAEASSGVKNRPEASVRERTSFQFGVVPTTLEVQLVVPAVSAVVVVLAGATRATSGATVRSAIAWASARVSVEAEPKPPRTPLLLVLLPGETISRLEPRASICLRTCSWAPRPRPTVRTTEEIPMTMPSMVSSDRSRWLRTASRAVRSVSTQLIG